MYGGVNTGASSSSGAASAIADDTHLIYDDCPGSRALMAAAAKTQQERQLYSFHSLPHYRQTSPGPNSTLAQQGTRTNSSLQQNPSTLPYGHQSANSTPRRATTSLSQNYISDHQGVTVMTGANSAQNMRNTTPLQRKQAGQPSAHSYSPHPLTPNNINPHLQLDDQMENQIIESRGILKDSQERMILQRRGSSASGKRYVDVYGPSGESHGGSRTTLTGIGSGGVGSLSSRTESNTVVEKMDYQNSAKGNQGCAGSTGSWRSSNKSATSRSQISLLSAGGGSFVMAQNKDSDDEDIEEQLDDANDDNMSSEDNLSHDSYELIERDDDVAQNNNDMIENVNDSIDNKMAEITENKMDIQSINTYNARSEHLNDSSNLITNHRKGSNQFEEEFYRQANSSIISHMGNDTPPLINVTNPTLSQSPSTRQQTVIDDAQAKADDEINLLKQEQTNSSSSKMSSRCSLNSSSILSPPPNVAQQLSQLKNPPAQIPASPDQTSLHLKPPVAKDEQSKQVATEPPEVSNGVKGKDEHTSKLLTRVNSQDSFSQASNHKQTPGTTPIPQHTAMPPGILRETSMINDSEATVVYDDFHGHEMSLHCHPQTPEERIMVDIVRNRGGLHLNNQSLNQVMQERLRQQHILQHQSQHQMPPSYYSLHHKFHVHPQYQQIQHQHELQHQQHIQPQTHHSLPRHMFQQNYQLVRQPSDPMHENLIFQHPVRAKYFPPKLYHPQQQQQQYIHPSNAAQLSLLKANIAHSQLGSRTLPNQRRGGGVDSNSMNRAKSPPFFPSRNRQPGECSSGSSSSHASPRMSRPKSLEFALNSANDITNAGKRRDAATDHQNRLHQMHHDYDDSSSAMSALVANEPNYYATSSSDVPQTPENPNTTLLDTVKKNKLYYSEERIYDVPEGIEGVTDKIRYPPTLFSKDAGKDSSKLIAAAGNDIADLTSPSSSSGINEPFPRPTGVKPVIGSKPSLPPPTTAPPPPPNANGASVDSTRPSTHNGQNQRHNRPMQKAEVEQRKFHNLLTAIDQRDSIESCESTSIPKPSKNILGLRPRVGMLPLPTSRPMLLPTMSSTSTEDDPSLSARSAPTPVHDVEEIIDITKDEEEELDDAFEEDDHYEKNSGTIKEGKKKKMAIHKQIPQLSVNLISPPGESESSTAVLTSEAGVPAPPPEFSSSAPIVNQDPREDTDVEDGADEDDLGVQVAGKNEDEINTALSSTIKRDSIDRFAHSVEEESTEVTNSASQVSKLTIVSNKETRSDEERPRKPPVLDTTSHIQNTMFIPNFGETDTIKRGKDIFTPPHSPLSPRESHIMRREDSIHEDEDIKIADMYIKVVERNDKNEYVSSGSDEGRSDTTSGTEKNGETDPDNLPFIDAERKVRESELMENLDGLSCGGSSSRKNSRSGKDLGSLSHEQQMNLLFMNEDIPNDDINARRASEEVSVEVEEQDAMIHRLPSLPTGDSASSLNVEDVSPIPPPLQLQDSVVDDVLISSSDDVVDTENTDEEKTEIKKPDVVPRCRILSRISERSSSEEGPQRVVVNTAHINKETTVVIDAKSICGVSGVNKEPLLKETSPARSTLSRSGSDASNERPEDTMSEQNCTTSEDNEANPPSLCSDLPENIMFRMPPQVHQVAKPQISEESLSSKDSKEFPSPPSSMLEATTTTVTQECKTEVTQIGPDSLFLEVTPPDLEDEKCLISNEDESCRNESEEGNIDEMNKISIKNNIRVDKIPYDISISSENEVTHNQETQDQNSEGSLHDSMEILEEIETEDHFDRDLDSEEEYDDNLEEKDIFEMPLISTVGAMLHPDLEQQASHQSSHQSLQVEQQQQQELPETTPTEENLITPYSQDQSQIQQLRLHQHSPNCRPPKPNGNGDEFIF